MKKFLLSFLASLVVLFSFAPYLSVKAADPVPEGSWYNQGFDQWYDKVYNDTTSPANEIFGERYTAAQVQWVIYGIFSFILNAALGSSNQEIVSCFLTNAADVSACAEILEKMVTSDASKALPEQPQVASNETLWQLVFADRPLSGVGYVKDKINHFKLVPEVQAQTVGFGFNALKPVQDMWRGMRNVAFSLFVLITIIFAFMIMFRVKISPQVVISIQSAIPKIIGALILTTFSYAIAGLFIDLMYIVIGLFSLVGPQLWPANPADSVAYFKFLTLGQGFSSKGQIGVIGAMILFMTLFVLAFFALLMMNVGIVVTALSGGLIAGVAATFPKASLIIAIIVVAIVVLVVVVNIIKTFWALTRAFATVLLLTIFAPLQITLGALIPNFGFGTWMKNYLAALSTFVVTGVLMLFSFIFLAQGTALGFDGFFGNKNFFIMMLEAFMGSFAFGTFTDTSAGYWPPLLGSGGGNTAVGFLFVCVSFVIFTTIPKATELVQSFIQGKPFAFGSAVGEAFGPVRSVWQATGAPVVQSYQQAIGNRGVRRFQKSVKKRMEDANVPAWIRDIIQAPPGTE